MAVQPKTIQIFLPDGNARSIRIAEITSRTIHAIQIPRSKVRAADVRTEPQSVGVYFLFGDVEESAKPHVYIGEAEDCYQRIRQHNQSKDFWTTAVIISSKTGAFDKAQARYLEWYFLQQAHEIGRYHLENSVTPGEPYLAEPTKADLYDYIGTTRILLSTLGFPVLQEAGDPAEKREMLYCGVPKLGIEASGKYTEDGFVVFKGSQARLDDLNDKAEWVRNQRQKLREDGLLLEQGDHLMFSEDYVFSSPSAAAQTVQGRPANGWKQWCNKAGQTLDELERQ